MKLRKGKNRELDQVVALAKRTFNKSYRPFLGDHNIDWYINSGEYKREIAKQFNDLYVLDIDGTIAGFIIYFEDFIHLMMVDEEQHRGGLGTFMLNEVEKELFKTYDTITLQSFYGNKAATSFYEKNGWKKGKVNNANEVVAMMYFTKTK